jgi:hypothetical protein
MTVAASEHDPAAVPLRLDPLTATREAVGAATAAVLDDFLLRAAAARLRVEIAALPPAAAAVAPLERLARER